MKFLNEIDGASKVIQDANNRFVTDSEKSTWNGKQNAITGGASTITSSNLTTNRALVSDSSGKVAVSAVTSTELGYISGVTSSIQTQLNGKASTSHSHVISDVSGLQTALDGKSASAHNHTLDGLSNTTITSNTNGEILRWNGSAWVNNTLAEAGIAPVSHTHTRSQITDLGTIASINTNASTSNYLRGDGTWVTPPDTTYSVATTSANGLMSSTDKTKLDGIATGANNYTHPVNHPPSIITQDASNRFVTDAEKATWNAKGSSNLALGTTSTTAYRGDYGNTAYTHSQSAHAPSGAQVNQTLTSGNGMATWTATNGDLTITLGTPSTITSVTTNSVTATSHTHALTLTKADITALGIPAQDTVYTHPATHPASVIVQDASNRFVTDTEKVSWDNKSEIPLVIGTQTTTTASWTGNLNTISSLYSGLTIRYWLPRTSASNVTLTLTLSGGVTTSAIACFYGGATRLTTHYPAGSFIMMTYLEGALINGVAYTGWWAQSNYVDGNTTYAGITNAEIDAGTATTLRTISGANVGYIKNNIVTLGTVQPTVGWWYEVIG